MHLKKKKKLWICEYSPKIPVPSIVAMVKKSGKTESDYLSDYYYDDYLNIQNNTEVHRKTKLNILQIPTELGETNQEECLQQP